MALGFFVFVALNGGAATSPCTAPECAASDVHALDQDFFFYSLAACTVLLAVGGAILAACCAASLSGSHLRLVFALRTDSCAGLVPHHQTGALLGLDMGIRLCSSRLEMILQL
jgi:hypothetical protein